MQVKLLGVEISLDVTFARDNEAPRSPCFPHLDRRWRVGDVARTSFGGSFCCRDLGSGSRGNYANFHLVDKNAWYIIMKGLAVTIPVGALTSTVKRTTREKPARF